MATISSPGIGSGLDVNGIVAKLMSAESQPLTALNFKVASYQAKLSGFGILKSALSQFQSALQGLADVAKFQGLRATLADATLASISISASASASSSATPGSYALEVLSLAKAQKLIALGQPSASAAIGNGAVTTLNFDFGTIALLAGGSLVTSGADVGKYIGTDGTVSGASFTSNGAGSKSVVIDASNNSLSGIRDAINKANIGVSATIVNDGLATPHRLVLTNTTTGVSNSMKISVSGDATISGLLSHDPASATGTGQKLSETASAQNANFKIDGIAVTKTSNTITDAIQGITLNLAKTNVGAPSSITVVRDTDSVTKAVNSFVSAYNVINQTLADAVAYKATSKQAAILNGESSVAAIQNQIRRLLSAPVAGGASTFTLLSQVGVSFQSGGSLALDNTKLQSAISNHFSEIAGLFAAVGKTSDSLVAYVSTGSKTAAGVYNVYVSQPAMRGVYTGAATAGFPLIIDGTNDNFSVTVDGAASGVLSLTQASYATAAALAAEIQAKINGDSAIQAAGNAVTVTHDGTNFVVTSNRYGTASTVAFATVDATPTATLGFSVAAGTPGVNVAGTLNGVAAVGSGQFLTGALGDASEGLKIHITGDSVGARGTVNYSQGYAYQLNTLANSLLGTGGLIASRADGLNASIKRVDQDKQTFNARLVGIEARYRAQFNALDRIISRMSSTSSFLTQQLDLLANVRNNR